MTIPTHTPLADSPLDLLLLSIVTERTGIVVPPHQKERFRLLVAEGCRKLATTLEGYIAALTTSGRDHPVFRHLVEGITINETYFFRDETQIAFLRDVWLPHIIHRRGTGEQPTLQVWSAASSSGEELYTIAMLLHDLLGETLNQWTLRLMGTDIDDDALAKAQRGVYTNWSFRCTPEKDRDRHFQPVQDGFAVCPALKALTTFQHLNLVTDSFPVVTRDLWNCDLILCRNVFIYFSQDVVRRVLAKLAESLVPEGILLLGASDGVSDEAPGLALCHHGNAFYFMRAESALHSPVSPKRPARTVAPRPRGVPRAPAAGASSGGCDRSGGRGNDRGHTQGAAPRHSPGRRRARRFRHRMERHYGRSCPCAARSPEPPDGRHHSG
ncbi:MAG: chemotaxis protein methyltransferase CheR [Rhodospirillaceae bacterium]|nr:MAG: chemotaxis protein methyltransferase CheR [Rhodospirillaceae bacterium]